ncbi:hypothetical protein D3C80_1364410 [compost metagenome]
MVAVGAVLGGQLPVALIDVAGGTSQHFQAIGGLVDDHVDDLGRLAQVLDERHHIGLEAAEQEATVGFEAGDPGQVVGAFAIETRRITCRRRVLDLEQLAGVVERPAMERAGIGRLVAGLVAAQHGAAMAAGVEEGIEYTVLVPRNENRLPAHGGGQEVVLVGDLALVGEVQPVTLEDMLHFEVEQTWIGEHLPFATVDAGVFFVLKQ